MIAQHASPLPPELQQQLHGELHPGEAVVWAAQPLPRLFRTQSIMIFLFGIPFTVFALIWLVITGIMGLVGHTAGGLAGLLVIFPLFGLVFLLVGLGMLTSPLWLRGQRKRTLYALTNQRAIIFAGRLFGGLSVASFEPQRLTAMQRNQQTDGSGDLIFEQYVQRINRGPSTVSVGFMAVENVQHVEELVRNTLLRDRAG